MSSEIMNLLCDAVKIKLPVGKPDQAFLAKLANAVEKAPDDVWEGLADRPAGLKAQKWVNEYSDREDGDNKSPIKMFPDWKAGDKTKSEAQKGNDDMTTTTKKKVAKKVPAKKTAPAAKAPAKKAKTSKVKSPEKKAPAKATTKKVAGGGSSRSFIKELVAKDPNISVEALEKTLAKHGYELSRLSVITFRNDMRNALKILLKLNMLKGAFDFD